MEPNAGTTRITQPTAADKPTPLVETIQTVRAGGIPSNQQLERTIDQTQADLHHHMRATVQSAKGEQLGRDTDQILEASKHMLQEKNPDEILQQTIYHAKESSKQAVWRAKELTPEMRQLQDVFFLSRRLARELVSSSDFRRLLLELGELITDIIGKRTDNIIDADKLSEKTQRVKEALKSDFVEGKLSATTEEIKSLGEDLKASLKIKEGDVNLGSTPSPAITTTVTTSFPSMTPSYVPSTTTTTTAPAAVNYTAFPPSATPTYFDTTGYSSNYTIDTFMTPGAQSTFVGGNYTQMKLTESEKRELAMRFKRILQQIASYPDYGNAIDAVFDLVDRLNTKISTTISPEAQSYSDQMWSDVRRIIERFVGVQQLDMLLEDIRLFIDEFKNDPRSVTFWNEFTSFVKGAVQNPEELDEEDAIITIERLIDTARDIFNDQRYYNRFTKILDEAKGLVTSIQDDPATRNLTTAVYQFGKDLVTNTKGEVTVGAFGDSLQALREVLLPVIIHQFRNIPIVKIEGYSKKYDYSLDNLHLSAYDILPSHVKLNLSTKMDIGVKEGPETDLTDVRMELHLTQIETHLENIRFAFKSKVTPKIHDYGIADIDIFGDQTTIYMSWRLLTGKNLWFVTNNVSCKLASMNVKIKEAKHSWLDKMIVKIWNKKLKFMLEREVENNLRVLSNNIADTLNDALYSIRPVVTKPIIGITQTKSLATTTPVSH